MSILSCFFCKDPSAKLCSCPSDPQPLCYDCLSSHKIAHFLRHADIICSTCDRVPVEMCIGCMSYICRKCSEKHLASCENKDIYPIEVYELAVKGEEGFKRLKRGKVVDNTISYLRQILTTIRQKTQIEVESTFRAVEETLALAKETVMTRLDEQIEKLEEEIGAFESRMNEVKYSESFTPSTNLEQLVFAESFPKIQSRLDSEHWFESVTNKALLSQISTDLMHVKKSTLLFSEVSAVCSWVGRYALIIGKPTHFCDLDTMEVIQTSFDFECTLWLSYLQLPSGEYFVCGEQRRCFLIDNNYSRKTEIGRLAVPRSHCGLALYQDYIYIFGGQIIGGEIRNEESRTIQRLKFTERQNGELLSCEMILERAAFCPCVYNQKIYLFGGMCPECEIFDPVAEISTFLQLTLQHSAPCIVVPFEANKLMVLCCNQYIFDVEKQTLTNVSYEEEIHRSPLSPLKYEGKYYFVVLNASTEMYQLASLTEGERKIKKISVFFSKDK